MARDTHLYRFSLDDRSTDFADLERGTASTAPVAWNASQRSNFDQPSLASDRVQGRRRDKEAQERMITLGLVLLAVVTTAVVFLLAAAR